MSGLEIERKFLVKDSSYRERAHASSHIRQGYICSGRGRTVRVRLRDQQGFLTIKGPSVDGGLSRYEFETEISQEEAEQLFRLCENGVIDKTRYLVASGRHTFEVDEFHAENDGLVIAEVELGAADEEVVKPDFIGREVTGDRRFYNAHLCVHPFCLWKGQEQEP